MNNDNRKGYKAFKPGLICAPDKNHTKQYAENTVFEEGEAVICEKGMHFCKNPFDVLDYYPLVDENGEFSDFAEVEALSEVKTDDDKKFCTTKLRIGTKLSFAGFIKACIDFCLEKTVKSVSKSTISSGDSARIGSSGDSAQIGSSGDSARIGSSGDSAQIGSSGDSARIGSSGDYTRIGSSGDSAQIGSSGDSARIGSSGYSAQIGSSGDYARIGSSGDYARINSTGENSVICCAGHGCTVKARKGSWITLAEWEYSVDKNCNIPKCVKTEYVDGEIIKEDTLYKLVDGEFVEVTA